MLPQWRPVAAVAADELDVPPAGPEVAVPVPLEHVVAAKVLDPGVFDLILVVLADPDVGAAGSLVVAAVVEAAAAPGFFGCSALCVASTVMRDPRAQFQLPYPV